MKYAVLLLTVWTSLAAGQAAPRSPSIEPGAGDIVAQDDLDALREEIVALRRQVDKLQTTIDVYVNGMVAELQDENTRLRRLLRRTYGDEPEALPAVPSPDQELLEDAIANPESSAYAPAEAPAPPAPPEKFSHTLVKQWGRSVEDAAQLGADVQSLKGMIVAVPEGSTDEQLRELAHELRREYDAFDNINIEVFETLESAKAFAAGDAGAGQSRVLSISKHEASGRDVAVLIRGDRTEEIPLGAP